jgi:hypothetical protein
MESEALTKPGMSKKSGLHASRPMGLIPWADKSIEAVSESGNKSMLNNK